MNKFILFLAKFVCSASFMLSGVQPYESILPIDYVPYNLEEPWIIYNQVNNQQTTVFIDVKSVNGAVSRYIAANTNSTVNIFNINPWRSSENAFQEFLSNVIQENQTNRITPIRMDSSEACEALNLVSECIYIEADPDNVYADIIAWSSHLAPHGVIMGNHWDWSDVVIQVTRSATLLHMSVSVSGDYWILKKH